MPSVRLCRLNMPAAVDVRRSGGWNIARGSVSSPDLPTHPSDNTSACSSSVRVAFSCVSGGYPYFLRIRLTIARSFARSDSRVDQAMVVLARTASTSSRAMPRRVVKPKLPAWETRRDTSLDRILAGPPSGVVRTQRKVTPPTFNFEWAHDEVFRQKVEESPGLAAAILDRPFGTASENRVGASEVGSARLEAARSALEAGTYWMRLESRCRRVAREAVEAAVVTRSLDVAPGVRVRLSGDAAIDRYLVAHAVRRFALFDNLGVRAERVRVISLVGNSDTHRAFTDSLPGGTYERRTQSTTADLVEAIASSSGGMLVVVGHVEGDSLHSAAGAIPIGELSRAAHENGTLLLPLGCFSGHHAEVGAAGQFNTLELAPRLAAALGAATYAVFLRALAGPTLVLELDPTTRDVFALDLVHRQSQERVGRLTLTGPVTARIVRPTPKAVVVAAPPVPDPVPDPSPVRARPRSGVDLAAGLAAAALILAAGRFRAVLPDDATPRGEDPAAAIPDPMPVNPATGLPEPRPGSLVEDETSSGIGVILGCGGALAAIVIYFRGVVAVGEALALSDAGMFRLGAAWMVAIPFLPRLVLGGARSVVAALRPRRRRREGRKVTPEPRAGWADTDPLALCLAPIVATLHGLCWWLLP